MKNITIYNSTHEKLLGTILDNEISFEPHFSEICIKASQTLHALSDCNLTSLTQRKLIMNAFIYSQFSSCPLVRMFHSRKVNNRINSIHGKALRVIYNDFECIFADLQDKDNYFTNKIKKWKPEKCPCRLLCKVNVRSM